MKVNLRILLILLLAIIVGYIILTFIAKDAITADTKYNTVYSKEFKEELFNNNLLGISESKLIELLGEPLKREKLKISTYYLYTNDTSKIDFIEGTNGVRLSGGNENFEYRLMTFDEKGVLVSILTEGNELNKVLFLGMKKSEIIEKFGNPNKEMLCDCNSDILSYSELKKGSYKGKLPIIELRKVVIGKDKLVEKVISKKGYPFNKYIGTCNMK